MIKNEQLDQLRVAIKNCLDFTPEQLVSRDDWGTINFSEISGDIERFYSLINALNALPLEHLPEERVKVFTDQLNSTKNSIGKIDTFAIDQNNHMSLKQSLSAEFKANANAFYNSAHIYIPYLAYQSGNVEKNIKSLNKVIVESQEKTNSILKEAESSRSELDKIIKSAREAAVKAGVGHFTEDFSEEAKAYGKTSKYWIVTTSLLALLTLTSILFTSYYSIFTDFPKDRYIFVISSKILIAIVLLYATIWCGKMYKSSKHLETVNRHRANALKTFQAFIQATDDETTRNAVLLETTRSIFTIVSSGLIDGHDGSSGDGGLKVMEIFKGINTMKSS